MARKPTRGNFLTNAGYQKALKKWNSSASTVKRTNKATNQLKETIKSASATITSKGRQGRSQQLSKERAQKALGEQFKTKGASKNIQSKLVKAGHSQSSLDLKRAKHAASKADRAEMNRLRRGTEAERAEYKKRKKNQRAQANKDAFKIRSSSWD
tara:strand:+ start:50 stop:514 length:465 start_codon:yes stop_codon:yes gene_type:complete